jgi:hypothetical protein
LTIKKTRSNPAKNRLLLRYGVVTDQDAPRMVFFPNTPLTIIRKTFILARPQTVRTDVSPRGEISNNERDPGIRRDFVIKIAIWTTEE